MIYLQNTTEPQEISVPRSFGVIVPVRKTYLTDADIADNLETQDAGKVLAARQGVVLKEMIEEKADAEDVYDKTEVDELLEDKVESDSLAPVATSGSYNDLTDKPTIPESDIFWAEYGVTTASAIREAVSAGKVAMCVYNGRTYTYCGDLVGSASYNFLWFMSLQFNQTWYVRVRTDTNQWQNSYANLESLSNRANTLTGNESSTSKYLTAKAVYDAIVAANGIFIAEYGVTTYAMVIAAMEANKETLVFRNNRVYRFSGVIGTTLYFSIAIGSQNIAFLMLSNNDTWSDGGSITLQQTAYKSQDIPTDRESTTKYPSVKAVFDSLGKWGVVSQTITWAVAADGGYDYTISDVEYGIIPQANIDLLVSAGATFNPTTGYFELGLSKDIAYDEILDIYRKKSTTLINGMYYTDNYTREMFPAAGSSVIYYGMRGCTKIRQVPQVINGSYPHITQYGNDCFYGCVSLEEIQLSVYARSNNIQHTNFFYNCFRLKFVRLSSLDKNIFLNYSPLITLECMVFIVRGAVNTSAITITLHPTAYARCQADTTEYTHGGNTYTGIIALAAAKNISIVSA